MKQLVTLAIIASAFVVPASAITYSGEISYTITSLSPGISGISVGDTLAGWFSYESPTLDGVFSSGVPEGMDGSLAGALFIPGVFRLSEGALVPFAVAPAAQMQVSGGHVTNFHWGPAFLPWEITVTATTITFSNTGGDTPLRGAGTVSFSTPQASAVPDSGTTLLLLGGSLASLSTVIRFTRKAAA